MNRMLQDAPLHPAAFKVKKYKYGIFCGIFKRLLSKKTLKWNSISILFSTFYHVSMVVSEVKHFIRKRLPEQNRASGGASKWWLIKWCLVISRPTLRSLPSAGQAGAGAGGRLKPWGRSGRWRPRCLSLLPGVGLGLSAEVTHRHGRPGVERSGVVKQRGLPQGDFISGAA